MCFLIIHCLVLVLQVFQVSDQCVKLWRDGWFQEQQGEPSGASQLRNPKVGAPGAAWPCQHGGRLQGCEERGWRSAARPAGSPA